jgi:hypothetical protein
LPLRRCASNRFIQQENVHAEIDEGGHVSLEVAYARFECLISISPSFPNRFQTNRAVS